MADEELKKLEEQIAKWSQQIESGDYQKVIAETNVASYMLLWNINDNLSLIRDILAVKPK